MSEEKQTLWEMMLGILVSTVFFSIIGSFIVKPWYTFLFGTLLGGTVAALILLQMFNSLNNALDMQEDRAVKYGTRNALLRVFLMGLTLVIGILLPGIFNILGILLGTFSLKFTAYLQPVIHKKVFLKN